MVRIIALSRRKNTATILANFAFALFQVPRCTLAFNKLTAKEHTAVLKSNDDRLFIVFNFSLD